MTKDRTEERETGRSVTEQASDWWVTLNAGEAAPQDHEAFREWAERSPERIEAFLETAALTRVLKSPKLRWPDTPVGELAEQAHREGAEIIPLGDSANPAPRRALGGRDSVRDNSRIAKPLFAVAASVIGILVCVWVLLKPVHRYDTEVGELRSVTLEDGSIVTLNTASRIDVKFEQQRRRIRLVAGEALFQVAHDPNRPFDVIAGDTTVRAVGTQFNVDMRPRRTVVTVVEGKVAILSDDSEGRLSAKRPRQEGSRQEGKSPGDGQQRHSEDVVFLKAGEQLTVSPQRALPETPGQLTDIAAVTAWVQRRLVFDHRPIGEVAEEFNRYNELQIEITGPALRGEQMTGVFKANDPESFLEFVARIPGVRIERTADNTKVRASL